MPISSVILKAFHINDEAKLIALCRQKKADAEQYLGEANGAWVKMRRSKQPDDSSVWTVDNKTYMTAPQGEYLGEGASGRVKLAICIDEPLDLTKVYAIKREASNTDRQQREATISKEMGIMVGDKVTRPSTTTKLDRKKKALTQKYYSVFQYLGKDLSKLLISGELSRQQQIDIAIQIALRLDEMHGRGYVHRDVKPENILIDLDKKPIGVHFIDFGFTQKNETYDRGKTAHCGTFDYMPGAYIRLSPQGQMELAINSANYHARMALFHDLKDADNFSLKRTIVPIFNTVPALLPLQSLQKEDFVLRSMLETTDENIACQRHDTAIMLAAHLLAYRHKISPLCKFTDEQSRNFIEQYQAGASKIQLEALVTSFTPPSIIWAWQIPILTLCTDMGIHVDEALLYTNNMDQIRKITSADGWQNQDSATKQAAIICAYLEITGYPTHDAFLLTHRETIIRLYQEAVDEEKTDTFEIWDYKKAKIETQMLFSAFGADDKDATLNPISEQLMMAVSGAYAAYLTDPSREEEKLQQFIDIHLFCLKYLGTDGFDPFMVIQIPPDQTMDLLAFMQQLTSNENDKEAIRRALAKKMNLISLGIQVLAIAEELQLPCDIAQLDEKRCHSILALKDPVSKVQFILTYLNDDGSNSSVLTTLSIPQCQMIIDACQAGETPEQLKAKLNKCITEARQSEDSPHLTDSDQETDPLEKLKSTLQTITNRYMQQHQHTPYSPLTLFHTTDTTRENSIEKWLEVIHQKDTLEELHKAILTYLTENPVLEQEDAFSVVLLQALSPAIALLPKQTVMADFDTHLQALCEHWNPSTGPQAGYMP